ncbi:MAG: hypothetical protein DRP87_00480 [Spirochaetes bacterium]|nr:MAG: hypothetical protein DRP87_00480 [Spirochaetota bacterium]
MKLNHQTFECILKSERSIYFDTFPTFIFRSVIGKELRKISCLFKNRNCSECSLKNTCAYSFIFETPVDKENRLLHGRNRAPHPFTLYSPVSANETTDTIALNITMFGKSIEYFPYLYFSLKQAGEKGIFRDRVRLSVDSLLCGDSSILLEEEKIDTSVPPRVWRIEGSEDRQVKKINIKLLSPLRLKYSGKYGTDFTCFDFLNAVERRARLLCGFFGEDQQDRNKPVFSTGNKQITERDLIWHDYRYYSSRQKSRLKMGGTVGSFSLEGEFSSGELSLLKGAELFQVGKNSVFGFGKISIYEED